MALLIAEDNLAALASVTAARANLSVQPTDSPAFTTTLGLTGAAGVSSASRWVGATVSGPPTSGTWAVGDFVVTQGGNVWVCRIAGTPGTWRAIADRRQVRMDATKLLSDTYDIVNAVTPIALTSQTIFGGLIGLHAGDLITNIVVAVTTAAAGTAATLVKLALFDSTGALLGVTANVVSDAKLTTLGKQSFPLTTPATVSARDGYYAAILQNGAYGTTQPKFGATNNGSSILLPLSGAERDYMSVTGQTDITGAVTLGSGLANSSVWFGVN